MKTQAVMQGLTSPEVSLNLEGYPGELTQAELDACQDFRQRLKAQPDPAYREVVMAWAPTEEEPYAICRFLRARKFDVDAAFGMLDDAVQFWSQSEPTRYDSVEKAVGQTGAVFGTQFPSVYSGLAHNGTVANFMQVGRLSLEGMSCLVELDALPNFVWFHFLQCLPQKVDELQRANPQTVVRCEEMDIVDLKHLTHAQISQAFLDALKNMFSPSACFPEFLNKAIVLNAPGFFSFVWRIIKLFLQPRTALKVEIYSDAKKGNARLAELMDVADIPVRLRGKGPFLCHVGANAVRWNRKEDGVPAPVDDQVEAHGRVVVGVAGRGAGRRRGRAHAVAVRGAVHGPTRGSTD